MNFTEAKHERRNRLIVDLAGGLPVVLVAFLFYLIVIRPFSNLQTQISDAHSEHQTLLELEPDLVRSRANLVRELQEIKLKTEEIRNQIPESPNSETFLGDVSRLAFEKNVEITKFQGSEPTFNGPVGNIQVDVHGEGTYSAVCTLLHEISELPRSSHIRILKIYQTATGEIRFEAQYTLSFAPNNPAKSKEDRA